MRAVERSVEERHPCYTPYSCFGLWRAFQRWRRAWCSAVYCVCGVPLSVVGAPDRIPPPCSCLVPLRHPLPHLTDSPHLFECVLMAASAHMLETVASSRDRLSRLERSVPMTSPCLRQRWGATRSDGAAARKCPHTVTHTPHLCHPLVDYGRTLVINEQHQAAVFQWPIRVTSIVGRIFRDFSASQWDRDMLFDVWYTSFE